jgi:two-component system nitrogen regulation response regulator GlnG
METTSIDFFDSPTDTSTTGYGEAPSAWQPPLVPGLVILAHPESARVGEEAPLAELARADSARLSRREPGFLPPAADVAPRPLDDAALSRRPLLFLRGPGRGEITLRRHESPTPIVAGGQPVEQDRVFSAEEIRRGVVLVLAGRVALLLQPLPLAPPRPGPTFGLIGHSPAMLRLRREIQAASLLEVPVLVRGETGTGKELVSRAVHDALPRRGPYLAVNLGALVPALAAAELFGATRGAYTGADRARDGYFRRADGGTLFLDEIGEAPLEVQVMLLRALESGKVQAVGGVEEKQVDVRVIAATDADLEAAIAAGRFRSALMHRLAGYEIRVPPLRERRDDVARLLFHFLREESRALGDSLADAAAAPWPPAPEVARLAEHDWPGNVRELKNVARRLAVLRHVEGPVDPGPLLDQLLRAPAGQPAPNRSEDAAPRAARREIGRDELLAALEKNAWRPGPTAKELGLSRPALYRLIEANPDLQLATGLGENELREALQRHGSVEAAARALKVSPQGLKRRLSALGLPSPTSAD